MIEGLTYHDDMAKAYEFLGLYGFAKCQDYHHFEEMLNYRELSHYYATHFFKLLQTNDISKPDVIPNLWYKYTSQAVDASTKKNAIKDLMLKWQNWEQATKKLYQQMYIELTNIGEVASAIKISKYLRDVDKELHSMQKKIIWLESINYNLEVILPEQSALYNKYKKAIKKI